MKRLIAVVLIVSMIFTTGGFATLADSVDFVIETTKNESVETTTSHKYYDEPTSTDYTEEPEEPEVDETTVLSDADAEQNFDGEDLLLPLLFLKKQQLTQVKNQLLLLLFLKRQQLMQVKNRLLLLLFQKKQQLM